MEVGEIKIDLSGFEKAGKAMAEMGRLLKEYKEKSRLFRLLLMWEDFKFDIKQFFKDRLLWVRYRIYKIKHPGPWTMR